jgi:hypothetical protein
MPARSVIQRSPLGSGAEEGVKIAVEILEEEVHVDNITRRDQGTLSRAFGQDIDLVAASMVTMISLQDGVFGEPAESQLRILGIGVIEDGSHKVPRVAILALDQHGPDVRLARDDLDVVCAVFAVADNAPVHIP